MPHTQNRAVMNWIFLFCGFSVFLVIYGGFVRLTRSGLSIVEWNPVSGAVPPLNQQAWQTEFAKYQRTPEYQQINVNMTLGEYKEIFIIEWLHRIFARLAGLIFAVPFFVFVLRKTIPLEEIGLYVLMGVLFLSQAVMGWIMVSSGLVGQPAVSHYLLTAHLFLALSLIGLSLWTALNHLFGFPKPGRVRWSLASAATLAGLIILLAQIAYGGFTAGLKAGHVSNTWPLMMGRIVPLGLLSQVEPPALNLISAPLTVAFIHRWLAFGVLIAAVVVSLVVRSTRPKDEIRNSIGLVLTLVFLQIALGILVALSNVQIGVALLHQANAIALFAAVVYLLHRLRAADRKSLT